MIKTTVLVIVLATTVVGFITACSQQTNNPGNQEPPVPSRFLTSSLSEKPVAPSTGNVPRVIDSYKAATENYYLLDSGYIGDVYISTIAQVDYTGVPLNFSKTVTETSQVTNSLTESISNSYYTSRTDSTKISIAFEESTKFGGTGFVAKQNLDWTWTGTTSETNTKSTSNTTTTTNIYATSQQVSYSFGNNTAAPGRYRYAIYGVVDVYYIITTSPDNQELLSWDVIACARPNDYFVRSEYSADGTFTNNPSGEVIFTDDYYKYLKVPTNSDPASAPQDLINFSGGNGTQFNPYIISNAQQFANINTATSSTLNKYYKLNANIQLGSWTEPFAFSGYLDGNGKKIIYSMSVIDNQKKFWGLFTTLNGATVQNMVLEYDINNTSGANSDIEVGGLAGDAINNSTISQIYVNSNSRALVSTGGHSYLGGILGYMEGGNIDQCANEAPIELYSRYAYVGGIIGGVQANTNSIFVTNCYNNGIITSDAGPWTTSYGDRYSGGIIGRLQGTSFTVVLGYCYNNSELKYKTTTTAELTYKSIGAMIANGKNANTSFVFCYYNSSKTSNPAYNSSSTVSGITGLTSLNGLSSSYLWWSTAIWTFSSSAPPKLTWIQ